MTDPSDPAATPEELCAWLDQEATLDAALQNPALRLVLLEEPELWARLSEGTHHRLVQSPRCPPDFVRWMLRQEEPQSYVLERTIQTRFFPLELRRACFLRLPSATYRNGWLRADPYGPEVITPDELRLFEAGLALAPLPLAELEQLARLGRLGAGLAAEHPDSPPALLEWLLRNGPGEEVIAALRHPHLPRPWLDQALRSPDALLRGLAAANPALTAAEADALAADADPAVRLVAARHPSLSPACMAALAADPNWQLRAAVAGHPALPVALLQKLRHDAELLVRMSVVERPDAEALLGEE